MGEVNRLKNENNIDTVNFRARVGPEKLVKLTSSVVAGTVSGSTAKSVLEEMFNTSKDPDTIINEKGLSQISDAVELDRIASQVIESNPSSALDYRAGKTQALKFLVGQAMKSTAGRADPKLASELLREKLEEG